MTSKKKTNKSLQPDQSNKSERKNLSRAQEFLYPIREAKSPLAIPDTTDEKPLYGANCKGKQKKCD